MPHLRFNRDKRGYENTFLVHTARRRGKPRSRILYWFRTPPGVRVGRSALDEDAIRLLEECHPDVEFDWTRILKSPPETAPEPPPQRARPARRGEDADRRELRVQPPPPEMPEPLPVAGDVEESDAPATSAEAASDPEAPGAALARLGPEGLLRLRARYAELMTRIAQRVADPAQQDELKTRAERLNPDNWVTDDEVQQGLDAYEANFEEIRAVVGRPRKRRRRRRGARGEAGASGTNDGPPTNDGEPESLEGRREPEPLDSVDDEDA